MKLRLKNARLDSDLSAAEVARELNISRSSVSAWENPNKRSTPSKDNLKALANLYKMTVDALVGYNSGNVIAGPDMVGTVPVVDINTSQLVQGRDMMLVDAQSYIFCPVAHGPDTYALRVQGSSMISDNPLENSYPDGRIIYCDPGIVGSLESGQNVIAELESGVRVFKQYRDEDGKQWLRPLNSDYDNIVEQFTILSVVIGSFQPE